MVTKLVLQIESVMIIIGARDFRESQGKYLEKALNGSDLILTTRDYGSFRIVPVRSEDKVYNDAELDEMVQSAIAEYEAGETISYTAKELREMANLQVAEE